MSVKVNQQYAQRIPNVNSAVSLLTVDKPILNLNDETDVFWNDAGFSLIQALVRGSGSVGASIELHGSLDGSVFEVIQTLVIAPATGVAHAGAVVAEKTWPFIKAKLSAVSGTVTKVEVRVRDIHNGA